MYLHFLEWTALDDGLEAVQQSKLAATVYNDKEGQARAMAQLAYLAATGGSIEKHKV
jgi:monosaccharide ABC transporter substrate-binding protein, CUT2 family (TC 3.A.1.2.-)